RAERGKGVLEGVLLVDAQSCWGYCQGRRHSVQSLSCLSVFMSMRLGGGKGRRKGDIDAFGIQ
ncbi:hypothetical protein AB8O53_35135, partial [Streptomyces pilosus]